MDTRYGWVRMDAGYGWVRMDAGYSWVSGCRIWLGEWMQDMAG